MFALILNFFVSSSIVQEIRGNYLYHIPWACSVYYNVTSLKQSIKHELIGACAILNDRNVFVSVDNFLEKPMYSRAYTDDITLAVVVAGSNFMDGIGPLGLTPFAQVKTAQKLYVGGDMKQQRRAAGLERLIYDDWQHYFVIPPDFDSDYKKEDPFNGGLRKDNYGALFNVGLLKLASAFQWTNYVRPMTMNFMKNGLERAERFFNRFLYQMEDENPKRTCITYSYSQGSNKIRYHEVSLVNHDDCMLLFCAWNIGTCDRFPNQTYLNCFKSIKFADVCPKARGAALYCRTFEDHSSFAILTTAPSCGLRNMPGVYTTLPLAIRLYNIVNQPNDLEVRIDVNDPFILDQKNDDYIGIN